MNKVLVFAGTRKGGLIFSSDEARQEWTWSDLHFKAWNVLHMSLDPRDQRLHVSASHDVFGPSMHFSDDFGESWVQAEKSPTLKRSSRSGRPPSTVSEAMDPTKASEKPEDAIKTWHITSGRVDEPGVLYAGVQPATLFKSRDSGQTWELNEGLYDHPHRGNWFPGAGGLTLHTILLHPSDPLRMWVAISVAGCYYTEDGGASWSPRNKNVLADFSPDKYPEYGQCVHKMVSHPDFPERIYQQNHCGIYRSDNGGLD